jgi:hypothetical protein
MPTLVFETDFNMQKHSWIADGVVVPPGKRAAHRQLSIVATGLFATMLNVEKSHGKSS